MICNWLEIEKNFLNAALCRAASLWEFAFQANSHSDAAHELVHKKIMV